MEDGFFGKCDLGCGAFSAKLDFLGFRFGSHQNTGVNKEHGLVFLPVIDDICDDFFLVAVSGFTEVVTVEVVGKDAGNDDDERDEQLQESGEDNAELAFSQGLGR